MAAVLSILSSSGRLISQRRSTPIVSFLSLSLIFLKKYSLLHDFFFNPDIEEKLRGKSEGVRALPGARELLNKLPMEAWGIGTSARRLMAETRLEQTELTKPLVLATADDVKHGKPEPEVYLKVAAGLGIEAGAGVVVEDAPAGIEAGRKGGMKTIAVVSTHSKEQLALAQPDVIVASLENVHVMPSALVPGWFDVSCEALA